MVRKRKTEVAKADPLPSELPEPRRERMSPVQEEVFSMDEMTEEKIKTLLMKHLMQGDEPAVERLIVAVEAAGWVADSDILVLAKKLVWDFDQAASAASSADGPAERGIRGGGVRRRELGRGVHPGSKLGRVTPRVVALGRGH